MLLLEAVWTLSSGLEWLAALGTSIRAVEPLSQVTLTFSSGRGVAVALGLKQPAVVRLV